jgi:hypothetical protein
MVTAYTLVFIPYINTGSIRFTVLRRFMRSEERFFAPLSIIYEGFLLYSLPKTVNDTAVVFELLALFCRYSPRKLRHLSYRNLNYVHRLEESRGLQ